MGFFKLKKKKKEEITEKFMNGIRDISLRFPEAIIITPMEDLMHAYLDTLKEKHIIINQDDAKRMKEFFEEEQKEARETVKDQLHIYSIPSLSLRISEDERAKEFLKDTDPKKVEEMLYFLKELKEY